MPATKSFIDQFRWITSEDKTHQYCVCESHNRSEFENLVIEIHKHGYIVKLLGEEYICYDIGKYLYWSLWDEVDRVDRINRMPK